MSIYPSPDKLDLMESKYALVILAAKRARQLKDGARKLIDTRSVNPLTIALEEIAEGAIIARVVEDSAVKAHQKALRPSEPTLEDIIAAGPVLAIEPEPGSTAAQIQALRNAEPDADDEEVDDDPEDELTPVDAFAMAAPGSVSRMNDDDDDRAPGMEDEDE